MYILYIIYIYIYIYIFYIYILYKYIYIYIYIYLSLGALVTNSRDRHEKQWRLDFTHHKTP